MMRHTGPGAIDLCSTFLPQVALTPEARQAQDVRDASVAAAAVAVVVVVLLLLIFFITGPACYARRKQARGNAEKAGRQRL